MNYYDDLTLSDDERDFVGQYIHTGLWADSYPEAMSDYANGDIKLEAHSLKYVMVDCLAFLGKFGCYLDGDAMREQAAHDFYLTRNGHGTGFWDRDANTYGSSRLRDQMDEFAQSFGPNELEIDTGEYRYDV